MGKSHHPARCGWAERKGEDCKHHRNVLLKGARVVPQSPEKGETGYPSEEGAGTFPHQEMVTSYTTTKW